MHNTGTLEMFLILSCAFLIAGCIYLIVSIKTERKLRHASDTRLKQATTRSDFGYIKEAMSFLDTLIYVKYNYYKFNVLMPIYLDNKIPEKKMVEEIKEKIYVSVVGGLTRTSKKSILDFFTEKGIEIYVHEKIIIHMNETDFRSSSRTESFKGLKTPGVDILLP